MKQDVKIFRIKGEFKQRNKVTAFSKELCEIKEENAIEKLMQDLGSRNRLKRNQIRVSSIQEISPDDVQDPMIKQLISADFKIPFGRE
ncbi:MAG: 50S ribosomal protein L18Ae [Candidatus Heimdallarchaeota archaeon]